MGSEFSRIDTGPPNSANGQHSLGNWNCALKKEKGEELSCFSTDTNVRPVRLSYLYKHLGEKRGKSVKGRREKRNKCQGKGEKRGISVKGRGRNEE